MNIKQLSYSFLASILFLLIHILVLFLKLSEGLTFLAILSAMIATQLLAFSMVRRKSKDCMKKFSSIYFLLGVTQFFSVVLLTVYSAFDPFGEHKAIRITDVITSIVLFVLALPTIITSIIWFTKMKKSV